MGRCHATCAACAGPASVPAADASSGEPVTFVLPIVGALRALPITTVCLRARCSVLRASCGKELCCFFTVREMLTKACMFPENGKRKANTRRPKGDARVLIRREDFVRLTLSGLFFFEIALRT
jgi:hypothetical protein